MLINFEKEKLIKFHYQKITNSNGNANEKHFVYIFQ
jgi:hypothetical protein